MVGDECGRERVDVRPPPPREPPPPLLPLKDPPPMRPPETAQAAGVLKVKAKAMTTAAMIRRIERNDTRVDCLHTRMPFDKRFHIVRIHPVEKGEGYSLALFAVLASCGSQLVETPRRLQPDSRARCCNDC
jgi:hypothetical protein